MERLGWDRSAGGADLHGGARESRHLEVAALLGRPELRHEDVHVAARHRDVRRGRHVEDGERAALVGGLAELWSFALGDVPEDAQQRRREQLLPLPLAHHLLERGELGEARRSDRFEQAARDAERVGEDARGVGACADGAEPDGLRVLEHRLPHARLAAEDEAQEGRGACALHLEAVRRHERSHRLCHV